ncbi:hypothetical protein GCM10009716_02680 [Streptomyces sodiiphilus]|uniref:Uncharacterized protein n=1 Tax=Streptomyces sodiiphilus TaxID=226217 RepID=A0ABP5A2K5_9ACTN
MAGTGPAVSTGATATVRGSGETTGVTTVEAIDGTGSGVTATVVAGRRTVRVVIGMTGDVRRGVPTGSGAHRGRMTGTAPVTTAPAGTGSGTADVPTVRGGRTVTEPGATGRAERAVIGTTAAVRGVPTGSGVLPGRMTGIVPVTTGRAVTGTAEGGRRTTGIVPVMTGRAVRGSVVAGRRTVRAGPVTTGRAVTGSGTGGGPTVRGGRTVTEPGAIGRAERVVVGMTGGVRGVRSGSGALRGCMTGIVPVMTGRAVRGSVVAGRRTVRAGTVTTGDGPEADLATAGTTVGTPTAVATEREAVRSAAIGSGTVRRSSGCPSPMTSPARRSTRACGRSS